MNKEEKNTKIKDKMINNLYSAKSIIETNIPRKERDILSPYIIIAMFSNELRNIFLHLFSFGSFSTQSLTKLLISFFVSSFDSILFKACSINFRFCSFSSFSF